MGMKLVGMVLTKWAPHLPDRAFRVLLRMAMTALDEPNDRNPAATFIGSRDLLGSVLRAERNGSVESVERSIERAIKDLVNAGAIERLNRPRAGRRATYRLTLFNAIRIDGRAVDNSAEPDTSGGAEPDTHGGALPDTSGSYSPTPTVGPRRKKEEVTEEQTQEASLDLTAPVAVPGPDVESRKELDSSTCSNSECILGYVIDKTKPRFKRNSPCPECSPPNNVIQFGRRLA